MHIVETLSDGFYDDLSDPRILSEVRAALRAGTPHKSIARQLGVTERELRAALGEPCWADESDDQED